MTHNGHIRKAAVLGAGVMGAQIAAHLTNAGIITVLFDLPADKGDKNAIVNKAIKRLAKLKPAPLASRALTQHIQAANYDDDLEALNDCDLVIEAIAERMDLKQNLYQKVSHHLPAHAIIASNTSGLSVNKLAQSLPETVRGQYAGIHFFNPPRYMHLVEVIPTAHTDQAVINQLESFLTTRLGKGVIYARDTPNFIGNRIGVFSILSTLHHTDAFKLGFDVVDALTGPVIGRPKSATYRTADVVGLDTLAHVVDNMRETLPDDPWHGHFKTPAWIAGLIEKGALGQKTGAGVYRKEGKTIKVLDLATHDYRISEQKMDEQVATILALPSPSEKFAALHASDHPQAQFLWAVFRDLFHYSACNLADIAETARDIDLAIRWGYGWQQGPFETWQAAGWQSIAQWINEDIAAGKTMSNTPLPDWVTDGRKGVHGPSGSWSPGKQAMLPTSSHPVYQRQAFPQTVLGAKQPDNGKILFENEGMRLWTLEDNGVGIISFKTKMHTVNDNVLDGIQQAIQIAERQLKAIVIWQSSEPFSAGADLKGALSLLKEGKIESFETMVANFQKTSLCIKYAQIPVVSAIRGLALGGGCEFQIHSARTVAALESYIGLVEAGVGLLPAGGGLKELALRAARSPVADPFENIKRVFETTAMAKVSTSALEAKELGLLRPDDVIVMNAEELLHVAMAQAKALAASGYHPPLPARHIRVAGNVGTATFKAQLVNMLAGHFISEHDMNIATRIADTLCGGDIEPGSEVDENWLLALERQHFIQLAQTEKTQARIAHTMQTGKPLRN